MIGLFGEPPRLRVRVAAPPVDSAANRELVDFLHEWLGIPLLHLEIFRGSTSKLKDVIWEKSWTSLGFEKRAPQDKTPGNR